MISFNQKSWQNSSLHWYSSSLITIPHAMLGRKGGVSKNKNFTGLNLSYATGDSQQDVRKNREIIKQLVNSQFLASCVQVHKKTVKKVQSIDNDIELSACDGLITDQPGVGLLIQQADCQAILFYDPVRHVIGAAHSGWRGNVENIVEEIIKKLEQEYGCNPGDLRAVISPSLGPCCAEFVNAASELPNSFFDHQTSKNHFNFWEISRQQLEKAGIPAEQIDITSECTECNTDFFSYRRAMKQQQITGRNGSIICLPDTQR